MIISSQQQTPTPTPPWTQTEIFDLPQTQVSNSITHEMYLSSFGNRIRIDAR